MFYEVGQAFVEEPHVESLEPYEVTADELPEDAAAGLRPMLDAAAADGFDDPVFHAFVDKPGGLTICTASLLHSSGTAVARFFFRQVVGSSAECFPTYLTPYEDGTYQFSSASASDMPVPAECLMNQIIGASQGSLWISHQTRLQDRDDIVAIETAEDLSADLEHYHALMRDYYLEGGVFEERDELEAVALQSDSYDVPGESDSYDVTGPAELTGDAAVLEELERLRTKSSGWQKSLFVLVISIGLFFMLGAAAWSWEFVLLLIPVLLFHELGHYVAMRVFGYRDVRMFFIPLAGAAVSGKHYGVPGWKRVVVSLMGPVPGIGVGIVLGIVALTADIDWLLQVATLMLFLNGFNLLPFLPLDGGWVVHTILFSRHAWLDAIFRILASLTLIGFGVLLGGRFLPILGVLMLLGVPLAFRLSRVVANARSQGLRLAAVGNDEIPLETAQALIKDVREVVPKGQLNDKTVAQFTLQVFEQLNARPPGWFASIFFLGVHGMSMFVALIFSILFAAGGPANLMGFVNQAAELPETVYECGTLREHPNNDAHIDPAVQLETMVGIFEDSATAEAAFEEISTSLPDGWRMTLFGSTVLVAFPHGDEAMQQHEDMLSSTATQVAYCMKDDPMSATVTCVAPDNMTAVRIEQEVQEYSQHGMQMHLIPPWSPEFEITEQQAKARRTYRRLIEYAADDPELEKLWERMMEAEDEATSDRLSDEYERRTAELELEFREELKAEGPEVVDLEVIDLASQMPTFDFAAADEEELKEAEWASQEFTERMSQWQREMGALLGQLPLEGDAPQPGHLRYSHASGFVRRSGLLLTFTVRLEEPADGLPAFAEWLCGQQCIDVRYRFLAELFHQFDPR